MARDNRQGQISRSQNGKMFEHEVGQWLERFMEDIERRCKCQNLFRLKHQYKFVLGKYTLIADHVILAGDQPVIAIGDKTSLKERWTQEDYRAIRLKAVYPKCWYISITSQENDTQTTDSIKRKCEKVKNSALSLDYCISFRIPEHKNSLRVDIENQLLAIRCGDSKTKV